MPSLSNEHFDLYSALHVPDSHSWPSSYLNDHPTAGITGDDAGEGGGIPVIDVSDLDASSLVGAACRSWGVFYATNHGVPAGLLALVESHARRLFSLPLHRKLLAARRNGSISGYGRPPLSSFFPKLMWSEGLTLVGDPVVVASQLWSSDSSSFCEVVEEYRKEMKKLAIKIMRLMLLSLGLDEEDMGRVGSIKELSQSVEALQLNSYPACPEPERAMGIAAHTDSAFLTVLHQSDGAGGLQVLRDEDGSGPTRWVEVPPRVEALVVNVGDLFHILSNGLFKNVRHRAVVNRGDHRVSAAYFIGPSKHIKVGPINTLVELSTGPLYRPITWPEYLGIRARLFDKALESVKLQKKSSENANKLLMIENY